MEGSDRAGRVVKQIGRSHVVWFSESNKWIEFKEPAWFVYRNISEGEDERSVLKELTKRYDLPPEEAGRFLGEIISAVHKATRRSAGHRPGAAWEPLPGNSEPEPYVTRLYRINGIEIAVDYGSPLMEHYFHRPLAHLETGGEISGGTGSARIVSGSNVSVSRFGLFGARSGDSGKYILSVSSNGGIRHKIFDDNGILKHHFFAELTNHIYGMEDGDWMTFIHASAVTDGNEAILFPSASGSGKSTLAALLQVPPGSHKEAGASGSTHGDTHGGTHGSTHGSTHGGIHVSTGKQFPGTLPGKDLYFMSDDFVAMDADGAKAHLFPAAISVKEESFGAIEGYYDPLEDADISFRGKGDPRIRYLAPRFPAREPFTPRHVKKIVFGRYEHGSPFSLRRLPHTEALAMFHREAWVSHNPEHARRFIEWFVTLECYRMDYPDAWTARPAIFELLGSRHRPA